MKDDKVKTSKGLAAYVEEYFKDAPVSTYKEFTKKDWDDLLKELSKPVKRTTSTILSTPVIKELHSAGILKDFMKMYDEVMIGSEGWKFLKEHGYLDDE